MVRSFGGKTTVPGGEPRESVHDVRGIVGHGMSQLSPVSSSLDDGRFVPAFDRRCRPIYTDRVRTSPAVLSSPNDVTKPTRDNVAFTLGTAGTVILSTVLDDRSGLSSSSI